IAEEGGLNLYRYGANSPAEHIDPSGQHPALIFAIIAIYFALDRYANAPKPGDPVYTGTAPNALAFVDGAAALPSLIRGSVRCLATKTPVFWAGGRAAEEAASTFATATNGVVIGETASGRLLTETTAGVPWSQARPQWLSLSEDFARDASGEVSVFHNVRGISADSIWRAEYRILSENPNVTGINFNVVMPNGTVVPVR